MHLFVSFISNLRDTRSYNAKVQRKFLQCGSHLLVAVTALNNDRRGDFNYVLTNTDCTGNRRFSKALETVVRGYGLADVWENVPLRAADTHYTSHGTARFDRIYVTSSLSAQKVGVETVVTASTYHLAVCLRIKLEAPLLQGGRGLWKMNTELLEDTTIRSRFQHEWTRWILQEGKYPDMVAWWEKYAKWKIRFLFIQEGIARIREDMINENFYCACIYDILRDRRHPRQKTPT